MPKRQDIHTVLIVGAGPIVIGQACEFDYSGAQACKALRAEGYRVVLVNSNPATIMTDPDMADATYIEPITPDFVEKIIAREKANIPEGRVFALLPTMGGQTALNTALSLRKRGTLEKYDVELIGASADAIDKAEDRELFRRAMLKIGLEVPRGITLKGELRHRKDEQGNFLYDSRNNPIMGLAENRKAPRKTRSRWWDCPPSSARPSRLAAQAAASPTTGKNSSRSSKRALKPRPPTKC